MGWIFLIERYVMTEIHQWYGIYELVSPYSNHRVVVQVVHHTDNDLSFPIDKFVPAAHDISSLPYSYYLSFKLHQWFVDQNIEYKLRLVQALQAQYVPQGRVLQILLSPEVAALFRLRWAGEL
jgi:hypothetical protein